MTWMDVALRHFGTAVTRSSRQSPNIATRESEPSQKRVPERVEYERPKIAELQGLPVLFLEAGCLDVPGSGGRGPDAAFFGRASTLPALL